MARFRPVSVRLLPVTMVGLAALLVVKTVGLVDAAHGAGPAPVARVEWPVAPPPWAAVTRTASVPSEAATASAPRMLLAAASPDAAPAATPSPASSPASSPAAGEAATAAPAPADAPALARDKLPGPAERSLLLDLRRRRLELDARAAAIEQREALLAAAEKRLGVRVAELTSLQTRLEALEAARQDRAAAEWQGLVRVYETMKPRDAAAIFNDLDQPVLLQVVSRMRDSKVAAILAAMAADRASRLTADLSALRARANDAPPTTGDPPARPAAAVPTDLPPPGAAP